MDTEEPTATYTLNLLAMPGSARHARMFVGHVVTQWGLSDCIEDAELVVSELATNAVQATADNDPSYYVNGMKPPPLIRVQLALFKSRMVVSVWDRSLNEPKHAEATAEEEDGRGLVIVEALSTRWGWDTVHPYSGHKGKVVWAELALPHEPVNTNGLPQRSRVYESAQIEVFERSAVSDGVKQLQRSCLKNDKQ